MVSTTSLLLLPIGTWDRHQGTLEKADSMLDLSISPVEIESETSSEHYMYDVFKSQTEDTGGTHEEQEKDNDDDNDSHMPNNKTRKTAGKYVFIVSKALNMHIYSYVCHTTTLGTCFINRFCWKEKGYSSLFGQNKEWS